MHSFRAGPRTGRSRFWQREGNFVLLLEGSTTSASAFENMLQTAKQEMSKHCPLTMCDTDCDLDLYMSLPVGKEQL